MTIAFIIFGLSCGITGVLVGWYLHQWYAGHKWHSRAAFPVEESKYWEEMRG